MLIKEACVETLSQAILAEQRGADRLELCSSLEVDGLTPAMELVEQVTRSVQIPVMVMIRPRPGNFIYTDKEIQDMVDQIRERQKLGIQGVVIGALNQFEQVDLHVTEALAKVAAPLQVTFHKAIDSTPDILTETNRLSEIPEITRILTSGGKETAWKGRDWINQMVKLNGERVKIVAAGRITDQNFEQVAKGILTSEFHGRKIVGPLS